MKLLLKNASVFADGVFQNTDVLISGSKIAAIQKFSADIPEDTTVVDLSSKFVFPGFVDVHVHLREPGFEYKETIKSGTLAAAHGGYTSVCAMPNLNPCPDCVENISVELDIIKKDSVINVYPYASVTVGQMGERLSEIESLVDYCVAFSDDGRGVQSDGIMQNAMTKIKDCKKILAAHCEDNSLLNGGYIHMGRYAKEHNHKGICSESEWRQIERDIALCEKNGCSYHVCHVSTKESVELIREAKRRKVDITCETAPHYLILCEDDLMEDGRYKMNPPLRSAKDKEALIQGIKDGTIDMIATDHAPHSNSEKAKGLKDSLMGITGLECAFSVLYTELVKKGVISLERLMELMNTNPSRRFSIGTQINVGQNADLTVFDLFDKHKIDSADFLSQGKITPFDGKEVYGKCLMTICKGETVWQDNSIGK